MKPEAQRIAIAEVCGWTYVRSVVDRNPDNDRMSYLAGSLRNNKWDEWEVPDYLNDLNAMHEAQKTLTYAQQGEMSLWITRMTCDGYGPQLFATAAQRAEAFLRTIGKWEEVEQ